MRKFDELNMGQRTERLLKMYAQYVTEALRGNTSPTFEQVYAFLNEAVKHVPENEREEIKKFLDYGRNQHELVLARQTIEAAGPGEEERKAFLGEFLKDQGYSL